MSGYILDKGLFKDNPRYQVMLSESMTVIENWMQTITEYKEYSKPFELSWDEYIHAVFHILGFDTEKVSNRLLLLKDFGEESFPYAIVGIISPGENLSDLVPGLRWAEFLYFSAFYYKADWGILFDGSRFQFYNLKRQDYLYITATANLADILNDHQTDSFIQLYKIFQIIKKYSSNNDQTIGNFAILKELGGDIPELTKHHLGITKREFDVLLCLAKGMKNIEIAKELKLSDGATRNYTSEIYRKLEVNNRIEALIKAKQLGLIDQS